MQEDDDRGGGTDDGDGDDDGDDYDDYGLLATGFFNSSGRSSNCDDGEMQDMHSDISIEDDVIDLNNKVGHSSFSSESQKRIFYSKILKSKYPLKKNSTDFYPCEVDVNSKKTLYDCCLKICGAV